MRQAPMGGRLVLLAVLLTLLLTGWAPPVGAHDPSAWGGIYRSRDHGQLWFLANPGRFVTSAIDLAISPSDPTQLLLATESGLLRSRNGGRDWETEAPAVIAGSVLAVAFDGDGRRALAATATALLRTDDGQGWRSIGLPVEVGLPRLLVPGLADGQVLLAGQRGLVLSDDWGDRWRPVDSGLPTAPVLALQVERQPAVLWAVVAGQLWRTELGSIDWRQQASPLPEGSYELVALDRHRQQRLWVAGADRLARSDDGGRNWQLVGQPLPDAGTLVRGLAADASATSLVLTTERGLYRSQDGGQSWELGSDALPTHLAARLLVVDPQQPTTLYAGFSVLPYDEIWQRAGRGGSLIGQLDPINLAGSLALLALLALLGGWLLRRLARYYASAPPDAPGGRSSLAEPALGQPAAIGPGDGRAVDEPVTGQWEGRPS